MTYAASEPDFTVNSTTVGSQFRPESCTLSDGRYVIVWVDADGTTTAERLVRAQIYNSDGSPSGGELTLVSPSSLGTVAVAPLPTGGFALAWTQWGVKVAQFDASGQMTGQALELASNAINVDIAASGQGLAVVWQATSASSGDTSGDSLWLRTLNFGATEWSPTALLNTQTQQSQIAPKVIGLANGSYLAVWTDTYQNWNAKGQFFDQNGNKIGQEINFGRHSSGLEPDVAQLTDGTIIVTWSDSINAQSVTLARHYSLDATQIGEDVVIPITFAGTREGPSVVALSNGGYALSWVDLDQSGRGISTQAFHADGSPAGPVMRANTQLNGDQIQPAMTALADGGYVVAWTNMNGATGGDPVDIGARRFGYTADVEITSNGGTYIAAVSVAERSGFVTDVDAVAGASGATPQYAIGGGADAALFNIDSTTGVLSFVNPPNFSAPADADGNNVYEVIVSAFDDQSTDTQTIRVAVTNVNDAPVLISHNGAAEVHLEAVENTVISTAFAANDPDGDSLTYSLSGDDAQYFAFDAASGQLSLVQGLDFESPTDANGDGIYNVTVTASDGSFSAGQNFHLTVLDAPSVNPVFTSFDGKTNVAWSTPENAPWTYQFSASVASSDPLVYSIEGEDAGRFIIDAATGVVTLRNPLDFEQRDDANHDGIYRVAVRASAGEGSAVQNLFLSATDVAEPLRAVSYGGAASVSLAVAEGVSLVASVKGEDPDGPVRYYIAGGEDAHLFWINPDTGALTFASQPADYERPLDAMGNPMFADNRYQVDVVMVSQSETLSQSFTISITNVREGGRIVNGSSYADTVTTNAYYNLYSTNMEDWIYGNAGADGLRGGSGNDVIDGGSGNDIIYGEGGRDELIGGTGSDSFMYQYASDSTLNSFDIIRDFHRWEGDQISLSRIDANSLLSGDQAFVFIGGAQFTGAGQLRYETVNGRTMVYADINGDKVIDFAIQLDNAGPLQASDFIL